MKKSVCAGYSTELLTILVHYTENADFLQTHGQTLHSLAKSGNVPCQFLMGNFDINWIC